QTPVLRINAQYVYDSAWIIERLEHLYAHAPPLFPVEQADRERAYELVRHFDFVVGPAARACAFVAMLDEPDYIARLFATGQPWLRRPLYGAALPLLKGRISKANDIADALAIKRANRLVAQNMESLRLLTFKKRYLVGNAFSVADLTAAS